MAIDGQERSAAVENMLCLALHAASRAMTGRYRDLLQPFGVTYPQYLVLLILQQNGTSSLVFVGDRLRLESSTLSPLVRRLETMGLVSRTRSTDDERTVKLKLTTAGTGLCQELEVVPDQISAATGLRPDEQDALRDELHRLEENLRGSSPTT